MSDPDDPFGRRDRTVISPNPGGRRPPPPPGTAGAPPPAPPSGGSPPTYAAPPPSWPQPSPPPAAWPQPSPPPSSWPPPPPAGGTPDAWMAPQPSPLYRPQAAPEPMMPRPSGVEPGRIDLYAANRNLLVKAAAPLLLLLARLRTSLSRGNFAGLMDQVAQSIARYESDLRQAGVPEETALVARYAVCATADDIVQNIPSDDRHLWTQYSMLARFFGERTGGVRFFTELERIRANPMANQDLLELMHACLALGFEGVHRTSAGGAAILQGIQRDVWETLRRVRSRETLELSPAWRGQEIAVGRSRYAVPVWAAASVAGVLLLGTYFALRALLTGDSEAVAAQLTTLHPGVEVAIVRNAITPPPPPAVVAPPGSDTQLQRIRAGLAPEIADGTLEVDQTANVIVVRVGNLALFDSGKATVKAAFAPIARRIAETLDGEPGTIRVIGHTDNVPIRSNAFASNFDLSEQRAKSVASLLLGALADPNRVVVEGKGEDEPIASNATAEGRAANRRVEIVIPRAD